MGTAIIIPSISFDDTYGKVTLVGNRAPDSIHIISDNSYTAYEVQLSVRYEPVNTTLRGIVWSVVSGNEYASIDSNGVLSINSNASSSDVTIRAVSSADGAVFDEKTVTVSYYNPITIIEKVSVSGNPTLNTHCALYDDTYSVEMKYKITGAPGHAGTLWGTLDEHSTAYAEDNTNIIVDFVADNDRRPITVGSIIYYRAPTSLNSIVVDEFFVDHMLRDGNQVTINSSYFGLGFEVSNEIYILHPTASYMFVGIDIYYFKIKKAGVVMHDFRAANNDGVYGFYDIISNNFISNTGEYGTVTA